MLVLSRKIGEHIRIDNNITITIVRIGSSSVGIGIDAPPEIRILREEVTGQKKNTLATHALNDH